MTRQTTDTDPRWLRSVVDTSNHFYFLQKNHGKFQVTRDMIRCETDRRYRRLCNDKCNV